jgi:hypothetical protein
MNLLCEVQAAQLRLLTDGPIKTMKELPVSVKRKLVTDKDGNKQEEIEIEIEDGNNGEGTVVEEDGNQENSSTGT